MDSLTVDFEVEVGLEEVAFEQLQWNSMGIYHTLEGKQAYPKVFCGISIASVLFTELSVSLEMTFFL